MNKTQITFALYLNENSTSLNLCLNQLDKLDPKNNKIIIYIDSNSEDLNVLVQQFINSRKNKNLTVVKNSNPLNKYFCYNDAIFNCDSEYLMFLNFNSIIENNFYVDIAEYLNNGYDVISFESTNPNIFYKLKGDLFTKLDSNLILGNLTKNVFNKLFNVEYLRKNKIHFKSDKWYPDYFLFQVLLTFKIWKNLENKELITFRKNEDLNFNLYDLIFQLESIKKLANIYQIGDEFSNELEFWYSYILKYKFLGKIHQKYKIKDTNNIQSLKNKEIQKIALQNVKKMIKDFCPNLIKNPHYKIFKKLLETYS